MSYSKGYPRSIQHQARLRRPVYSPNRGRNGFIVGGDPSHECPECYGVGGHFTYCAKAE